MSRRNNKTLDTFEPSLTKQSFKDECNINNIIAKYRATGVITHTTASVPAYRDCISLPEFQDASAIVALATEQFIGLPAKVRARFANDPENMIAFLDDPKNLDEAIKLGIVKPLESSEKAPAPAPEKPEAS